MGGARIKPQILNVYASTNPGLKVSRKQIMTGFSVISAVMIFSLCCWTTTASSTTEEGQEKFIPNTMYKVVGRYAIVREHAEAVTGPCDCPHGEIYRRNGFLPLAEDSSDECDQCHGTGEVSSIPISSGSPVHSAIAAALLVRYGYPEGKYGGFMHQCVAYDFGIPSTT